MVLEHSRYLAHHGVKGQKWGVRRYQNEDGTLINPKGRPESRTWKGNEAAYLSDEELSRRNKRLQAEINYRRNVEDVHPVKKEFVDAAKKVIVLSAVTALSTIAVAKYKSGGEAGLKAGAAFVKRMIPVRAPSARMPKFSLKG